MRMEEACGDRVYKARWRSSLTSAMSESWVLMTLADARAWRDEGNRSTPELEHWVIRVDKNGERVD